MKRLIFLAAALSSCAAPANTSPVVTDVRVSQRLDGTNKIDIYYDLEDADKDACEISVLVSNDAGASWTVEASAFSGDIGAGVQPGSRHIVWDCEKDLPTAYGSNYRIRVLADDGYEPLWHKSVLIDSGRFEMGDHTEAGDADERPVHQVSVGPFHISATEATNGRYCEFLNSAMSAGAIQVRGGVVYSQDGNLPYCNTRTKDLESRIYFDMEKFTVLAGLQAHPVVGVSWYGAAAYCNWLSEMHELTPCYDPNTWRCDFTADGYRLPTEAEWEYAARGGIEYAKYPWGDAADKSRANWFGSGDKYEPGPYPCTTPVGSYAANGYGLYDIAGNVWEWCNDRYSAVYYSLSENDNPRGPESGTGRVVRGGCWKFFPMHCRVSTRRQFDPHVRASNVGFRVVRTERMYQRLVVGDQ